VTLEDRKINSKVFVGDQPFWYRVITIHFGDCLCLHYWGLTLVHQSPKCFI